MINPKYIFYGSGPLAESTLYYLYQNALVPTLVITTPDKTLGRGQQLEQNIIAKWCASKDIQVWQVETLRNLDLKNSPLNENFDFALVASYPKILPEEILNLPKSGTLNIHPSLLPKYRGSSPIQSALLNGDLETGVSIIKLDSEVDHGPILIQKSLSLDDSDTNEIVERRSGEVGAKLLMDILESYLDGILKLIPQDEALTTFTHKFQKSNGEIKLSDSAEILQNKFRALLPHIPIYFSLEKNGKTLRVKVTEIILDRTQAKNKTAQEIILKVIPEGKSEMSFADFERGYLK